ncbi:MAG: lectin-like protein [Planctomycetota bacterium]
MTRRRTRILDHEPRHAERRPWLRCAAAAFACVLMTAPSAAQVLLADAFNGPAIDLQKWTVVTGPVALGPTAVFQQGGECVLQNRGRLVSKLQFDPTVLGGIRVSGTFRFGSTYDYLSVGTRSDAMPVPPHANTANGIQAGISWESAPYVGLVAQGAQLQIGLSQLVGGSYFQPQVGTTYSFEMLDTGSEVQMSVTGPTQFVRLRAPVIADSTTTKFVEFYNREAVLFSHQCFLDNVQIEQWPATQWITNPATGNEYTRTPPMTWAAARAFANSLGADLCVIDDLAENTWVANQFLALFPLYLGGTDMGVEGLWTNINGWPLSFTNWAPNQPDNFGGNQNCLVMWDANPFFGVPRASWDDGDGTAACFAVLERPIPQWVPYGLGCPGSNGTPSLAPSPASAAPQPGATLSMHLANLPTSSGAAIGVLSLSSAAIDLGPIGLPGCMALVGLGSGLLAAIPHSGTAGAWQEILPNLTVLRGLRIYAQALVLDPAAGNPFGATTTGGLEIRIGY